MVQIRTLRMVCFHILQNIVHPPHIPFIVKTKSPMQKQEQSREANRSNPLQSLKESGQSQTMFDSIFLKRKQRMD